MSKFIPYMVMHRTKFSTDFLEITCSGRDEYVFGVLFNERKFAGRRILIEGPVSTLKKGMYGELTFEPKQIIKSGKFTVTSSLYASGKKVILTMHGSRASLAQLKLIRKSSGSKEIEINKS